MLYPLSYRGGTTSHGVWRFARYRPTATQTAASGARAPMTDG